MSDINYHVLLSRLDSLRISEKLSFKEYKTVEIAMKAIEDLLTRVHKLKGKQ